MYSLKKIMDSSPAGTISKLILALPSNPCLYPGILATAIESLPLQYNPCHYNGILATTMESLPLPWIPWHFPRWNSWRYPIWHPWHYPGWNHWHYPEIRATTLSSSPSLRINYYYPDIFSAAMESLLLLWYHCHSSGILVNTLESLPLSWNPWYYLEMCRIVYSALPPPVIQQSLVPDYTFCSICSSPV